MARELVDDDAPRADALLKRRQYLLGTATATLGTATSAALSGSAVATDAENEETMSVEAGENWKTLTVVGQSDEDIGNYEVTVSDAIVAVQPDGTAAGIPNTAVEDAVGSGAHTYHFLGEVVDYSLEGPVELYVDE